MHTKKNNKPRKNSTIKSTKERICILKNGLGNKLFILANILNEYKDYKVYFVEKKSKHQFIDPEKLSEIFPNFQTTSWKEYEQKKAKGIPEINYLDSIYFDTIGFVKQRDKLQKLLKVDDKYNYLLDKYDFKNGIFVHIRYGDKLNINYQNIKHKQKFIYPLLKPDFYIDSIKILLKKNPIAPIYIFTDSKKIVKCLFENNLPEAQIVDEGTVESFFCFKNCNKIILSDSTLSQTGVLLNNNKNIEVIYPYYTRTYRYNNFKKEYFDYDAINFNSVIKNSKAQKDPKYLLTDFENINEIYEKCDIPKPD